MGISWSFLKKTADNAMPAITTEYMDTTAQQIYISGENRIVSTYGQIDKGDWDATVFGEDADIGKATDNIFRATHEYNGEVWASCGNQILRYKYIQDISSLIISADTADMSDSPIRDISFTMRRPDEGTIDDYTTLFCVGGKITVDLMMGDSSKERIITAYCDEHDWSQTEETMTVRARNGIGYFLSDATFDENTEYVGTRKDIIYQMFEYSGIALYNLIIENDTMEVEYSFKYNDRKFDKIKSLLTEWNWQIAELPDGRIIIGSQTLFDVYAPKNNHTFDKNAQGFEYRIIQRVDSAYSRVAVVSASQESNAEPVIEYRDLSTFKGWGLPKRTKYIDTLAGTSREIVSTLADEYKKAYDNIGVTAEIRCPIRPNVVPGDSAIFANADLYSYMPSGVITSVRHTYGIYGVMTRLTVDSGGYVVVAEDGSVQSYTAVDVDGDTRRRQLLDEINRNTNSTVIAYGNLTNVKNSSGINYIVVNGVTQENENGTVNITVPVNISELTNDSKFQTDSDVNKTITNAIVNATQSINANIKDVNTQLKEHKNATELDHPDGSVTTAKIADDAVQTDKVKNRAITAEKIAEGVIPTELPASDVPEWAKQEHKPEYTADEVGALGADDTAVAAKKLEIPVTINGAEFDGTKNITVSDRKYCMVGSNSVSNGWYKVAEQTMSGSGNTNVTFMVTFTYASYYSGIFQLQMRSDNTQISCRTAAWLVRRGFPVDGIRVVVDGMKYSVYIKQYALYGKAVFEVLSESTNSSGNTNITLFTTSTPEAAEPIATVTSSDGGTVLQALQDGSGNNIEETYLPFSGGEMAKDSSIKIRRSADDRYIIYGTGVGHHIPTSGYYAMGMSWYANDDTAHTKTLGSMGAYGGLGKLDYYYIGGTYDDPLVKIDASGNVTYKGTFEATGLKLRGRLGAGSTTDWRTLAEGRYAVNGITFSEDTHSPVGAYNFGTLFVFASKDVIANLQIYIPHRTNRIYVCTGYNNAQWTGWTTTATKTDVDAKLDATATAIAAFNDGVGNNIAETYAKKQDASSTPYNTGRVWLNGSPIYRIDFVYLAEEGSTTYTSRCVAWGQINPVLYGESVTFVDWYVRLNSPDVSDGHIAINNIDNITNVTVSGWGIDIHQELSYSEFIVYGYVEYVTDNTISKDSIIIAD